MEINSRQELPVQLGPAYYQYAVDKIMCSRSERITQSMALKCVGLYVVLCRMVADHPAVTQTKLADRLGVTFPGINRPLEYLKRLKLVSGRVQKVPGTQINVQHLHVPRPVVEMLKRDVKRSESLGDDEEYVEYGQVIPKEWHDPVGLALDACRSAHTAGKMLKALAIATFMARLAADGLPVTRPVLSRKLGIAENTLTPMISFLEELKLIAVEERRVPGHIGTELAIYLPTAIIDRCRRAVRRLEKEGQARGWPDSEKFREMARCAHQQLGELFGQRTAAE